MAKILLVEDDNNLREIYQARLIAEGYDIVTAQNGEEALVVAKQHRPDLVISDVMMPRISGFEMLDILRNTPELGKTKVIMLTALGQAEDQTRAGKLGADRYLVKSQVTLEDIVNATKDLLAGATIVTPGQDIPQAVAAATAADAPAAGTPTTAAPPAVPTTTPPAPDQAATGSTLPAVDTSAASAVGVSPTTESATPLPGIPVADPDPITTEPAAPTTIPEPTAPPLPSISTHSSGLMLEKEEKTVDDQSASAPETPPEAPTEEQPATEAATTEPTIPAAPAAPADPIAESLAEEEAAVEAQIAQFSSEVPTTAPAEAPAEPAARAGEAATELPPVENVPTETPAAETTPENPAAASTTTAANDAVLTSALEQLQSNEAAAPTPALAPSEKPVPADAAPPTQEPPALIVPEAASHTSTAPATQPTSADLSASAIQSPMSADSNEKDQVNVAGKKVIAPLNDLSAKPDLQALLADQEARDLIGDPTAETFPVVVNEVTQEPQEEPAPLVAPPPVLPDGKGVGVVSPAPESSTTSNQSNSTSPKTDFDPNSVAL